MFKRNENVEKEVKSLRDVAGGVEKRISGLDSEVGALRRDVTAIEKGQREVGRREENVRVQYVRTRSSPRGSPRGELAYRDW